MSDDLAALFTTPQIRTDTDGRHWDTAGVEYDAVTVGGELAYVPQSGHPVVGELWECRRTDRAVIVEDVSAPGIAGGQVHVRPVGCGMRSSIRVTAFLRDWKRADDRYQLEHLRLSPETGV